MPERGDAAGRLSERARSASRLSALGARPLDRLRIAALVLAQPLRRRLRRSRTTTVRVRVGDEAVPWVVDNDSDLLVLDEIFRQAIYPLDGVGDPGTIVDLGSHVGASILFFRRRFPDARIVGFEPDPANFRKLSRNVGHLSGVELHNIAIAAADGPVEFYESGAYDGWASSLTRSTPWQRPVQVEGRTLESALAACGIERIDLLKIDVEGAEYAILGGYRNLGAVAHVIGEVHAPRSAGDLDGLRERLSGHEHDLPSALPEGSTAFRASLRG